MKKIMQQYVLACLISVVLAASLLVMSCGSDESSTPQAIKIWHYEGVNSAMTTSWNMAFDAFEKEHPNIDIDFENKGFEQIRQTASMVLNSNQPPDVMEYNKGNATAGLLSSQGLLEDLSQVAVERGWDKIISPSLQITSRYNSEGIMGSGKWYGITNYGEYVMAYYNKDLFDQYNLSIPQSLSEFESVMQTFVDNGITPLSLSGAEYPAQQVFYALALSKADQDFINAYQLYQGETDFQGPEFSYAANTMVQWVNKGYISETAVGMKAEDMGLDFINGNSPIMISGSWWFGRMMLEITEFQWGTFLFPGNQYHLGSGGNLWVVPAKAENKELAYDFIDITLRPEMQQAMAEAGGIPINADPNKIETPQVKELIENFNSILNMNGLAFYPDWPVPGFYDVLVSNVQKMLGSNPDLDEILSDLQQQYDAR